MGNVLVISQVNASGNDAHQVGNTTTCTINDATFGVGTSNTTDSPPETAAFRFTGVSIPQGAAISSASLKLCSNGDWLTINGIWYGEAADNSSIFVVNENLNSRSHTTANFTWTENVNRAAGTFYGYPTTGDWTAIVQEIVNRAGWASGNAMSFLCLGNAVSSFAHGTVRAFDTSAASGAILTVAYFNSRGGVDNYPHYISVGDGMSRSEGAT